MQLAACLRKKFNVSVRYGKVFSQILFSPLCSYMSLFLPRLVPTPRPPPLLLSLDDLGDLRYPKKLSTS